jgi:hypothetical protein
MTPTVTSSTKSAVDPGLSADRMYDELSKCKSDGVRRGPVTVRSENENILVFDSRKYYDQAHNYHHAITLALDNKPVPYFLIGLADLSLQLKSELNSMPDARSIEPLLKQAVLRIFQDLDDNYNRVFPLADPISKKFRVNLCNEIPKILKVKLVK